MPNNLSPININFQLYEPPNTVEGTLGQYKRYFESHGSTLVAETRILPDVFELIMQGKTEQYLDQVCSGLIRMVEENKNKTIVAAQLSMVRAAQKAEQTTGVTIGNSLASLAGYLSSLLSLESKSR